jgi:hypothetical protein
MSKHRKHAQAQPQEQPPNTTTELDFDLSNYSLDDLYKLFKLPPHMPLNPETLKRARKILVYTHPDKSGLPPHYFNFFTKAYGILEEMEGITNNIKKTKRHDTYVDDINSYSNEIHHTIKEAHMEATSSHKRTAIMKEFNNRFEEINRDILPQNDNRGYSEWMKHENPEENTENHRELYAKRKQELRDQYALSTNKIQSPTVYSSSGSSLLDQSDDFTSGLFDNMQYTDLKKSYTETIIPVGEEDFQQMPTYSSVEQYQRARNNFNAKDPTVYRDHHTILNTQQEEERRMSNYRAYELARQLEQSEQKNKAFLSQFHKILN